MHESTPSFTDTEAGGHTWERRSPSPEDAQVLRPARNWLNALPKGVRPVHLPAEFPRIANDLFRLWRDTVALDLYFEEKLVSLRPARQGLPPLIKEELLAMQSYAFRNRAPPQNSLPDAERVGEGLAARLDPGGKGIQGLQFAAITGANAVW